jgi:Na+/H+ antiporter NhaD/arsenite permease-like protein
VLAIFVATYLGVAFGHCRVIRLDRTGFALLGAIGMVVFGALTFREAIETINFHTIALVFALMVISSQLHHSGFYTRVSEWLVRFIDRPSLCLFILMMSGALASSFFNNTVIALAVAPVLVQVGKQKGVNPVPFLIGLCMCNNGSLTLIGNPQNVYIGELSNVSFMDYTLFAFPPVFLCALACYGICWALSRHRMKLPPVEGVSANSSRENLPEFNKAGTIKGLFALLILVVSFILTDYDHGMIALAVTGFLLCSHTLSSRQVLARVDWQTLLLFIGLFIVIGAFQRCGFGDDLVSFLSQHDIKLSNPLVMIPVATGLSNAINNTAAVMLLSQMLDFANNQTLAAYALALSNSLTGNLILVGSLSNMIMIQCAEQAGFSISFKRFFCYGLPCTLASMLILLAWFLLFI